MRSSACSSGLPASSRTTLDRDPPQGEPALELGLERQALADLRLDLELALGVALLAAASRDERVPAAALVVVDEVDRLAGRVLEREDRAQHALAVAADRKRLADRVDADVEVVDDHPAVAELVVLGLDGRAGLGAGPVQDLLHLRDDRLEVARRQRLEDDRRAPARGDP